MTGLGRHAPGGRHTSAAADRGAFGTWVTPHVSALSRYAHRLVPADVADDVVQEALVRAWSRWSTYDPSRGAAAPWLLAIVADQARRHRTRAPQPPAVLADDAGSTGPPEPDVDLERAVASLSERQRQAVDLYYFVGLDVASVAQTMGCAPGTVQATLHHARARLRELLGDSDD